MAAQNGAIQESPPMNLCIRLSLRAARLGATLVVLACCTHAYADVRLPNGEYTTTVEDLKVKVIGGYLTIARSWTNGRWYANPQWADLKFTYDSLDGSVRGIDRAGTIYERTSVGLYVYKVDQPLDILKNATGWRWYDPKGNWVTYDPDGHLTAYGDRNVQVTFTLDGSGRHTQVQDQLGQLVLSFQYTGDQLTGVTDRVGRQVRYQYTGGNLTQVTDVLGNASSYTYDSNGQLTTLTDQEGHTTTIVYAESTKAGNAGGGVKAILKADAAAAASVASTGATPRDYKIARVFTVTDPEGNITTYLYDYDRVAQRFTVTQKFPGGRTVTGVYDVLGRLRQQTVGTRIVSTMTRDGDRTEMIADERGLVTTTVFDGAWNPIKITYPDGTSVTATYDSVYSNVLSRTDEAGTQTTYQYDAKGNLTQMIEAVGFPEQRTTTYTYDPFGERLTTTRKGATLADDATTTYTYDSYGNVATATNPVGNLRAATHDAIGNSLAITDPRGNTWSNTYNAKGWPLTQTDPLGHATTTSYDKVGNRTMVTDALGNNTVLAYNKNSWLISITDPLNSLTQYQYDSEGRKTKEIDPVNSAKNYVYDGDGRMVKVMDGNGNITETVYGDVANALNGLVATVIYPTFTEQYKYDQANNVTQVAQVLATPGDANYTTAIRYVTTRGYDAGGNLTSHTDASGNATQFSYDRLDRLAQTIDAAGGGTSYGYDTRDNRVGFTDANGSSFQFQYDKLNRVIIERRPLMETTRFTYDTSGNLTSRINAMGQERRFAYDSANRLFQEQYFEMTAAPSIKTITYVYDGASRLTGYADGLTSATYIFNGRGQIKNETVNYGAFSKTIVYGYHSNGKRASFTFADGTIISFAYDSNSNLKTLSTSAGTLSYEDYIWNAATKVLLPGVTRVIAYDALQRPTRIASQGNGTGSPGNPNGNLIMDYRQSYDALSNVTRLQTLQDDSIFRYDNLYRLIEVAPQVTPHEQYSYDGAHNRLTSLRQPGPWRYDPSNRLLGFGQGPEQLTLDNDPNGNTIRSSKAGAARDYTYDIGERLTQVSDEGGPIASYYYDPFGRRLRKTAGGNTTWYQYSTDGLVAEYDNSGTTLVSYGWNPNRKWGTDPQFLRTSAGTYLFHNDHLGTPQRLTDIAGNVAWSGTQSAFGEVVVDSFSTVTNNLRLPGQYHDDETTLHYNYFRYYDPQTGRYWQADPIGLRGGVSLYAYVTDNPLGYIDPLGLSRNKPCLKASFGYVPPECRAVWSGSGVNEYERKRETNRELIDVDVENPGRGVGPNPDPVKPPRGGGGRKITIHGPGKGVPIKGEFEVDWYGVFKVTYLVTTVLEPWVSYQFYCIYPGCPPFPNDYEQTYCPTSTETTRDETDIVRQPWGRHPIDWWRP